MPETGPQRTWRPMLSIMMLILGGAQLGLRYGPSQSRTLSKRIVSTMLQDAAELGFGALDTAPGYGRSEALAGETWTGEVHTKISSECDPVASLKQSLKSLRRKHVDIAYFHDWRALRSPENVRRVHAKLKPMLATKLGVSIYDPEDWQRFLELEELEAVQLPMSVLDQRFTNTVWDHSDASKQVFARSALFRGLLAGEAYRLEKSALKPQISLLRQIAGDHRIPLQEIAIRWILSVPGVTGIVLGADSLKQMRESARMFKKGPLQKEIIDGLRDIPQPDPELLDLRRW